MPKGVLENTTDRFMFLCHQEFLILAPLGTPYATLDMDGHAQIAALRQYEGTGRPLGWAVFVRVLDFLLGRPLSRQKPGPKPKGPQTACLPDLAS